MRYLDVFTCCIITTSYLSSDTSVLIPEMEEKWQSAAKVQISKIHTHTRVLFDCITINRLTTCKISRRKRSQACSRTLSIHIQSTTHIMAKYGHLCNNRLGPAHPAVPLQRAIPNVNRHDISSACLSAKHRSIDQQILCRYLPNPFPMLHVILS